MRAYHALSYTLVAAALSCGGRATFEVEQFPVAVPDGASSVEPQSIVAAPDGNIWFTISWLTQSQGVHLRGVLARLSQEGQMTLFDSPEFNDAVGIAAASDNSIWFTDLNGIGRMNPDGTIEHHGLPDSGSLPVELAEASDGSLWFTESDARVGVLRTDGTMTEFALPQGSSRPIGIVAGADDAIWFVDSTFNEVDRLTPDGVVEEHAIPGQSSGVSSLAVDSHGEVWFSEKNAGKIGRLAADGSITEVDVSPGVAEVIPLGIAVDRQGGIWFADLQGGIGFIGPDGAVTETKLPTGASPNWIAADSSGKVWFSEVGIGAIGAIAKRN
jgi:virginiamycin B lyase